MDAGGSEEEGEPGARPNGHATLAGGGGDVVVLGLGGGGSEEEEGEPGARPNGLATLVGGGGDVVDDGGSDDAAADAAAAGAATPPAAVAVASVAPTCICIVTSVQTNMIITDMQKQNTHMLL